MDGMGLTLIRLILPILLRLLIKIVFWTTKVLPRYVVATLKLSQNGSKKQHDWSKLIRDGVPTEVYETCLLLEPIAYSQSIQQCLCFFRYFDLYSRLIEHGKEAAASRLPHLSKTRSKTFLPNGQLPRQTQTPYAFPCMRACQYRINSGVPMPSSFLSVSFYGKPHGHWRQWGDDQGHEMRRTSSRGRCCS